MRFFQNASYPFLQWRRQAYLLTALMLLLGIGASLAGGCTVGHSLVGVPLLSVGSIVTTVFIVLGSWTAGYFEIEKRI